MTSVLAANTLLPALLGLLGTRINSWRVLPARLQGRESRLWETVSYAVMKRPLLLVLVMSCALIALMLPLGGLKLGVPNAEVLPPRYESRSGSDLIKQAYDPGQMNPLQVYVEAKGKFGARRRSARFKPSPRPSAAPPG
ncbi:hypothetical protein N6H14_00720 [Paenibacillus sp. CC-CFT747]|nr:hypothetical protein N6H14_00720 [Paenibacillus sp. CC-CFT747]